MVAISAFNGTLKAGAPRTKEQILQELKKQVKLACSGVKQHVKDLQTETGVKHLRPPMGDPLLV